VLQKPDLDEGNIVRAVLEDYGISIRRLDFLPVGADQNTFGFRGTSQEGSSYFIKLRSGTFEELSVILPKFLWQQGLTQVIPPRETVSGGLWTDLAGFSLVLYPYIHGKNGYQVVLSKSQWEEFGRTVRMIHGMIVPEEFIARISREKFLPHWRKMVRNYLPWQNDPPFADDLARELAGLLAHHRQEVSDLIERAELLASRLVDEKPELVLCHSDLHAGNILIADDGSLYIVDWDNPILAPRERDTMYAGGGQFKDAYSPEEEEAMFYRGYGPAEINLKALAYYRYERIIEDIAIFCEQILQGPGGEADRNQAYQYLQSNFLPGGTIEIARKADKN
jgi:spectinomycin phosphotransferase